MTAPATKPTTLQEQARELQSAYPELFAYLSQRDAKLRRALRRVPSPADIELSAAWNQRKYIERTINDMGSGIGELTSDS